MAQGAAAQIEYNIYTFEMPSGKKDGPSKWKLNTTTADMMEAMQKAENLHGTKKFHKVEVKKKFFDAKKGRVIDMTLKNFEQKPTSNVGLYLCLAAAVLCGVIAFGLTYILAQ